MGRLRSLVRSPHFDRAKKKALPADPDRLTRLAQAATINVEDFKRRLRDKVGDVTAVLGRQTPQARQMLRKVLGGEKIELELVGSGRGRGFKFRGALCIDKLIGGDALITHPTVVAPTGHARR